MDFIQLARCIRSYFSGRVHSLSFLCIKMPVYTAKHLTYLLEGDFSSQDLLKLPNYSNSLAAARLPYPSKSSNLYVPILVAQDCSDCLAQLFLVCSANLSPKTAAS